MKVERVVLRSRKMKRCVLFTPVLWDQARTIEQSKQRRPARDMGKLRLSLASNSGAKKGNVTTVVLVEPAHDAIAAAAIHKLKLKCKQTETVRLFLKHRVGAFPAGTELPQRADLTTYLQNDAVITVSIGDSTHVPSAGGEDRAPTLDRHRLPPLPRWPDAAIGSDLRGTVGASEGTVVEASDVTSITAPAPSAATLASASALRPPPLQSLEWEGSFPVLEGCVLPLVREAITGSDAFTESNLGGYISFDYKSERGGSAVAGLFPPLDSVRRPRDKWLLALRRECRGLLLCASRGTVLARRFHKFFNLSERPETEPQVFLVPLRGAHRTHTLAPLYSSVGRCTPLPFPLIPTAH